jgi:hypothetical protein
VQVISTKVEKKEKMIKLHHNGCEEESHITERKGEPSDWAMHQWGVKPHSS